MQSSGGGNMNAAQLARLQQQLAQYGRGQPGQQQQVMNANAMGGMGNQQQQLQQAYMQQQYQQNTPQAMQQVRRISLLGGNALAMMQQQQQQQQQGNNQMANANMSNYFNALQNQGSSGAMDASSASSAQLAALAGMNMGSGNNMGNQANSMLLGNRSTSSQGQVQGMGGNQQAGMGGQTNNASMLQQQIAQLQRQLEQQQQQQTQSQGIGGMSGNIGMSGNRRSSSTGQNFNMQQQQQQQQQLFQQMQQMGGNPDQFSSMAAMIQGQNPPQVQNVQQRNPTSGSVGGLNGQQDFLLQQQQMLRSGGMQRNNNVQTDLFSNQPQQTTGNTNDISARRSSQMMQMEQMNQSMNSQSQNASGSNPAMNNSFNNFDMDGSTNSRASSRQQTSNQGISPLEVGNSQMVGGSNAKDPLTKSFLDGSFAGGWQSNADLPDRRRIIFSILEVIRQMRPDTNKISQKLPHMAKSLEEHLYRSAQTKEEYLDPSTLKKRLQLIAHGLELHRTTSTADTGAVDQIAGNTASGAVPSEAQQLQQFLQMQGGNMNFNQGGAISRNSISSSGGGLTGGTNHQNSITGGSDMMLQGLSGLNDTMGNFGSSNATSMDDNGHVNDQVTQQKKKVIRQQQQRLLLLRHASKCKEGANCKTKFCPQMMTLWKHMKKCRDKSCKTPHCLSSRCVLNHYRICKSQGRTATCEVCGPVMDQIKSYDVNGAMDSSDPLAAKADQNLPQLQQQMSSFGNNVQQQQQQQNLNNNAQAMQQQAMQQLYQKQQQAIQQNQNQQVPNAMGMQNTMDNLNAGGATLPTDDLQNSQGSNQLKQQQSSDQQPQNLQSLQQKLQQQQQVLRQLQKQQSQLLEQQKHLQEQQQLLKDPGTQQGQQLQQQHALLQQLQRRCQQQQALIQQELMITIKAIQGQQENQQMGSNSQNSQQMGNNSQNSQQNQIPMQNNSNSQGMPPNQNQLQAQMEALSQSHMEALNDNKGTDDLNPMGSLQDQMSKDPLQDDLLSQPLGQQQSRMDQPQHQNEEPSSDLAVSGSPTDPFGNVGQLDIVDKSDSKEDSSAPKARSAPGLSRGKGARGRGGKGKRLRDIADDLLPAESAAVVRAGGSISLPMTDGDSSKKRSADQIGGGEGEPAQKTSKLESGPDESRLGNGEGSEKNDGENDPNASLASSMPKGDVEQNLMLLHKGLHLTSRTITHKCLPIVQQLIDDPFGWVFRDAVDPVVFGLPDYFEVVKNPMHLLLVKKKLENAVYTDMASFERDVKLVFENAILYNGEDSEVGQLAHTMMGVFEKEYKKVCEVVSNDLHVVKQKPCKVCGTQRRQFEPPVLYCASMACDAPRIQRNASYYTYGSNQNCWCEPCYRKLSSSKVITLDDGSEILKARLLQSKHDSLPEEVWIECDECHSRVHQICALYNGRMSKPNSVFWCPACVVKKEGTPRAIPDRAVDLPKCSMSDFMEEGLQRTLATAYKKNAKQTGCSLDEIEKADGLCIRVMSHIEKKHVVREEMYQRYSKNGCPTDFPVHTKCVGLFQSFDGVDVLLFSMYVYEYGDDCPAPNRRRVYISYLDSVQYFQPKAYRSIVYQSVIVEYLRFVKKRGFHTAHIWSCPPAPGDEYVFYCHPSHQKIPQEEQLRNWYYQTLETAKADGIVLETTDFYDEYFNNEGADAPIGSAADPTSLPYFEGDYIPGEIEKLISQVVKEEKKALANSKSSAQRSGSKKGTRSNPGNLVNQSQDKVMLRLGNAICNMKENFIVARLRNKRFVAAVDRGEDVSAWPDNDTLKPPGKDSSVLVTAKADETQADTDDKDGDNFADKLAAVVRSGTKIGDTVDLDEQFESELFENRQLFLNYCQTNHCQFDELRRAKHSTIMVLYQLHNPMAPKFVSQCGACYRDIANGTRYHCNNCANFDLCQDCYRPVTGGSWANRGSRFTHDSKHSFTQILVENSEVTQQQQAERVKTMRPYLQVLSHAADCDGPPACSLNNCQKMKQFFSHVKTCELTHKKGCKICSRLLALIIVHARSCTTRGSCSLPFCDRIRERNERLRRQQQLMDDRRRDAQNEYYQRSSQS